MDIKITGVNRELTHQADGRKYNVYLSLSNTPPYGWARLFDQEWKFKFYSSKRHAHVEGNHIVILCPPEEIEPHHKQPLTEVVEKVNRLYVEFDAKGRKREEAERRKKAAEEKRIEDILNSLEF